MEDESKNCEECGWPRAACECEPPVEGAAPCSRELVRLRDLLDWAESLICNAIPMAHCTQEEWDAAVNKWRDQKHGVPENDKDQATANEK